MAGTQNYGRADYQLGQGAHHACGKQFPTCNGEFMPFGRSELVDIHLTHRAFMYLATALLVALAATVLRRPPSARVARLAKGVLGLLLLQLLLGATNVWIATEYELLILAHLAVGTLLWATTTGLAFQLFRVPEPVGERPAGRPAEAVPA